MGASAPAITPELDVSDLDRSVEAYTKVLGFRVLHLRPEERFAYLIREAAHIMLEELSGPGRRFHSVPMEFPFGRGMNLQIEVSDVSSLYSNVQKSDLVVHIPLEERWYRQGNIETGNRQFVVADPDGYLLRFFSDVGERPVG
ncbi:bleomycin resistance protein [Mesorhizobium sp. A556]